MTPNDYELLTAYLDQQLSPRDKAAFESRLKRAAELRQTLADLRLNRVALRNLPRLKTPRNFTLARAQAEAIRQPRRRGLPFMFGALRLATALGALSFMVLLGADAMGNVAPTGSVANAPALEAADADPSVAREALTDETFSAFAVESEAAPVAGDTMVGESAPAEEATPDPAALTTLATTPGADATGTQAPMSGDVATDGLEFGAGGGIPGTVENPVASVDLTAIAQQHETLEARQSETPAPSDTLGRAAEPATAVAVAPPAAPTAVVADSTPVGAIEQIRRAVPLAPLTLGVGALTVVLLGLTLIVWASHKR